MIKKKIIVLLAAFNGEKYIKHQINSIINQSIQPYKIIINVDNSSDQTLDIIKIYAQKNTNIKIINTNMKFGSGASNFIYLLKNINFSDVDFIALSDQDDIWHPDKLERAQFFLDKGYDGYSSNVEAFWEDGSKKNIYKNHPQKKYDYLFESAGPGCTYVFNKKLALSFQSFIKKNNFDYINQYHDWLIYAFSRANGFKWYIDKFISLKYRQHENNAFGANVGIKSFIIRARKVLMGDGFNFALHLIKVLPNNANFPIRYPLSRIKLLHLAFLSRLCRRRKRDQFYFFMACFLLSIVFPNKIKNV